MADRYVVAADLPWPPTQQTIPAQVAKLKERFGLERVVVIGDRGMVTQARIRTDISQAGYDWISALRHGSIQPLVQAKIICPSLFDERGIADIAHPDYPGERLIACFNPFGAADAARAREELLALTEKELQKVDAACRRERNPLRGVGEIGTRAGVALAKFKMGKYFKLQITEDSLSFERRAESLVKSAAMDGCGGAGGLVDGRHLRRVNRPNVTRFGSDGS